MAPIPSRSARNSWGESTDREVDNFLSGNRAASSRTASYDAPPPAPVQSEQRRPSYGSLPTAAAPTHDRRPSYNSMSGGESFTHSEGRLIHSTSTCLTPYPPSVLVVQLP